MNKTLIKMGYSKKRRKVIDLHPTRSRQADDTLLKIGLFWDVLSLFHKDMKKLLYIDKSRIHLKNGHI